MTDAHDHDRCLQSRIDEAGDEDHTKDDGRMVTDVRLQIAVGERREKNCNEQNKPQQPSPQKRLNKGIMNAGRH